MYRLGVLLVLVTLAVSKQDTCFNFPGDSYLQFSPTGYVNRNRAHYKLQFRTSASDGLLLYTEGEDDYEALFLLNGSLVYLLVNPTSSGVEGTSGGLYMSNAPVNNNTWLTVDLWRNWSQDDHETVHEEVEMKTGMEIESPNRNKESHVDSLLHDDIILYPTVFIGGVSSNAIHFQGSTPAFFQGRIRGLYEAHNQQYLDEYDVNLNEGVKKCS